MRCPSCNRFNADGTAACECGYQFTSGPAAEIPRPAWSPTNIAYIGFFFGPLPAGVDFQVGGSLDDALAEYNEALRLDPDFDEALQIDSEFAGAHYARAIAYTVLGKDTEADDDLERFDRLGGDAVDLRKTVEEIKAGR